jgi:ATP-dependent protease ClpP protease subunit
VGDGLAMMEMINRMRRRFDVRIDTVVLGYAYSMGAIVSQTGDHRSIGRSGTLMLSWSGRERFLEPDECLELGLVVEILEPANLPVGTPNAESPTEGSPQAE